MRAVVQRVRAACVLKNKEIVSKIGRGIVIYIGICRDESIESKEWLIKEIQRVHNSDEEILCLSQFTLYGGFKGTKPTFHRAAETASARVYYEDVVSRIGQLYGGKLKKGIFQEYLEIVIDYDGETQFLTNEQ